MIIPIFFTASINFLVVLLRLSSDSDITARDGLLPRQTRQLPKGPCLPGAPG